MSKINTANFESALLNFSNELSSLGIPNEGLVIKIESPSFESMLQGNDDESAVKTPQFECHRTPGGLGITCTFGSVTHTK